MEGDVMGDTRTSRREFCKGAALVGAAAVGLAVGGKALAAEASAPAGAATTAPAAAPAAPAAMPTIKLGGLAVSRLILGSNPFFGFDHGNPQASGKEMTDFYTDDKIKAVLDAAADQGVTAVWVPCYERWIKVWNEYRQGGGKLKVWIGQPDRLPMDREIMAAVDNGAKAVCIQGAQIDGHIAGGKWDVVRGWLELIKKNGLPAGMATHTATAHLQAEEKGLPTDFYHQTMYRPDDYVKEGLEESFATIAKLAKPVVGYKVLGAGRFAPKDALPVVLKRLKAKDGICLGMFPKKTDEIAENAALVRALSVA
jgi:hypothetical protein